MILKTTILNQGELLYVRSIPRKPPRIALAGKMPAMSTRIRDNM